MPDDAATVLDILAACRRIRRFLQDVERRAFHAREEKHWAVASQLLVIGEAVTRLSAEFQDRHNNIPWRRMAGMRNRLIHEYDKINWELVWRTATREIPLLQAELEPEAGRASNV
jgi:uncharacterized protein with HEPN domain